MQAIEKLNAMLLAITGSAGTSEMPAEALDAYLATCLGLAAEVVREDLGRSGARERAQAETA